MAIYALSKKKKKNTGCFHVLATVNNAATNINIGVHIFL